MADDDYPAAWVWKMIGGRRENVVKIDYKPLKTPEGNFEVHEWTMRSGDRCIMTWVDWRVTYRNNEGVEVTEPPYDQPAKRFPIYTRVPYPDVTDPEKEYEAARQLKLTVNGYCYPVVASMDPSQKDPEFWDRVDSVRGNTKVYVGKGSKEGSYKITYGDESVSYNLRIPEIARNLIHTGKSYFLEPELAGTAAGQRAMKISPRIENALEPAAFGERSKKLQQLQNMPPEAINVGEIRGQGIEPKEYINRLQKEIEQGQGTLEELGRVFFKNDNWSQGALALSKEFSDFIAMHKPTQDKGIIGRIMRRKHPSIQTKREQLLDQIRESEERVYVHQRRVQNAPESTPAEVDAKAKLNDQVRVVQDAHQRALQALQQLDNDYRSRREAVEGPVAMMEALQGRLMSKQAQLESLLQRPVAEGGFNLNGSDCPDLTPEEKSRWSGHINANWQTLQRNANALQLVREKLTVETGMDFDNNRQRVSADAFINNIASIGERVLAFSKAVPSHLSQVEASFEAHSEAPDDPQLRQEHLVNLETLHRDMLQSLPLQQEIDRDIDAITRVLTLRDLSPETLQHAEDAQDRLRYYSDSILRMQEDLRNDLHRLRLEPLGPAAVA